MGFPGHSVGKKICMPLQEMQVPSLGQEDPLEEDITTHSSILPGKSIGQGSLAGPSL